MHVHKYYTILLRYVCNLHMYVNQNNLFQYIKELYIYNIKTNMKLCPVYKFV